MVDKTIADLSAASSVEATTLFETENVTGPASEKSTAAQILAYVSAAILAAANTFSGKQTFTNFIKLQRALEKCNTIADNLASGDNNFDILTASIWEWTTAGDTNATLNFRGDGSNSLDSLMAVGEFLTVVAIVTHTGTAYYVNAVKIDGSAATVHWPDGTAPSAGSVNAKDHYVFTIKKTASATFDVYGQKQKWDTP